jgi:3-deoxy-manno-octulosonate cytidylyltransferase (CMP-KDO synthetase)
MRVVGVIPARMNSSRFPGKPLASIQGHSMLEHVYGRARACAALSDVVIATCDEVIVRAASGFGAKAIMTSSSHTRASERVAEVAARYEADVFVMIQGDEPLIRPEMIEAAVAPMQRDESIRCINLAAGIRSEHELRDRNTIKVVMARDGRALYFSRESIPNSGNRPFSPGEWHKQVCVIPFRREALLSFASLPRGPLEELESIDMLRFLENGLPVHMVLTDFETHAVDVPDDLEVVSSLLARYPWPAVDMPRAPT